MLWEALRIKTTYQAIGIRRVADYKDPTVSLRPIRDALTIVLIKEGAFSI